MSDPDRFGTRRGLLVHAAQAAALAPWLAQFARHAYAQALPPTPACGPDSAPTASQTEGPYYSRRSPQRTSLLEAGVSGERLVLGGKVLGTDCKPIANALLDFWQADAQGAYDNDGYRLRGHLYTDAEGRYRLETIVPGVYPGRTRHIHVKVQPPGGRVLTTQLYFPDEAGNRRDFIYTPSLQVAMSRGPEVAQAAFDFVLRRA